MRHLILLGSLLLALGWGASERTWASELVHEFVNPAFGGNPLNGPFLLNSATLQNSFTEAGGSGSRQVPDDLLGDFEERLNRAILSRLSRELVEDIFGNPDEITTGTFTIGDLNLEITDDGTLVTILITDLLTGDTTTIEIPPFHVRS